MALNYGAISTELTELVALYEASPISWADIATFCKIAWVQARQSESGVTSYTIAGRSITRDADAWSRWYRFALDMANVEDHGGIGQQDIYFRERGT